jgi:hypothetical protein
MLLLGKYPSYKLINLFIKMGCGVTRVVNFVKRSNTTFVKSLGDIHDTPFIRRKEHFEEIHNKFLNKLTNKTFLDDLDQLEQSKDLLTNNIDILWEKYKDAFLQAEINHNDYKLLIVELMAEQIIIENFGYKEQNVFKFVGTLLGTVFKISADDKKLLYDVLTENEGEYLRMQKCFIYDIALHQRIEKNFLNMYYKGIHNNLKFNKKFDQNAIAIVLTPQLLGNENIMRDLPEIIQYADNLNTVAITLHPISESGVYLSQYNLTPLYYSHMMRLFKAIKDNRRVQTVIFTCAKDYKIILPPEITKILIDKVDDDSLMGLYIGNFMLSPNFIDQFWKAVIHLKNLMFLGYNVSQSEIYLEKIKDGVLKNKSLQIISLSGFEFEPKELEGFRKMLSTQTDRRLVFNYQEVTDIIKAI